MDESLFVKHDALPLRETSVLPQITLDCIDRAASEPVDVFLDRFVFGPSFP